MTALVKGTDFSIQDIGTGALGGLKVLLVKTVNTADATNTIPVTLTDYGIAANGFLGLLAWTHTTDNSVSVMESDHTTAVSSGVLTITVGTGTNDDARLILIFGLSGEASPGAAL